MPETSGLFVEPYPCFFGSSTAKSGNPVAILSSVCYLGAESLCDSFLGTGAGGLGTAYRLLFNLAPVGAANGHRKVILTLQ